jgi:hypothetical protein
VRRLLIVVSLLGLLAACSAGSPAPEVVAAPDATAGAAAEALDFTAPTIDGGQLEGSSLAGGDVALWFWAPW